MLIEKVSLAYSDGSVVTGYEIVKNNGERSFVSPKSVDYDRVARDYEFPDAGDHDEEMQAQLRRL